MRSEERVRKRPFSYVEKADWYQKRDMKIKISTHL